MMRRCWIYILLSLGLATGCSDRSYGGLQQEEIFDDTTEPIPVKAFIGSAETILPKGSGVIDDPREWGKDAKFYVYAFNQDMFASYAVTSRKDNSSCLIDGSKDIPGTLAGKQAYLDPVSSIVMWSGPDETVIYPYGNESGIVYDFFAYYMDDIQVEEKNISRLDDKVMIQVEIDGSQDLMSSKARVLEDQLAGFLDEDERVYITNYCYGYYAARKGIDPVFIFKHHLTKLNFELIPAYNNTGKRQVTLKRLEVKSKYKAMFTVADKGSTDNLGLRFDDDDYMNMPIREADGSELAQDKYTFETLSSSASIQESVPVGTSLLVAPSDQYMAYVYLKETFSDGTVKESEVPLEMALKNPEGFLPGNGYRVNVSVYGATRVDVDVKLVDWNDGGKVSLDDEDLWGNNGEY